MLEVKNVNKIFSEKKGINNITFCVEKEKVTAVIGPNGAGKTTLFNIIAGITRPDSGEVLLDGLDVKTVEVRQSIGYLPDTVSLNPKMKVIDLLSLVSDYKFNGKYKREIDVAVERYELNGFANVKFESLSMGLKKKVGILMSFMGNPRLIILDEPTNGLDTNGIIQLKNDINIASRSGSIILISSHVLDFVSAVAQTSYFLKDTVLHTRIEGKENLENVYKELYMK